MKPWHTLWWWKHRLILRWNFKQCPEWTAAKATLNWCRSETSCLHLALKLITSLKFTAASIKFSLFWRLHFRTFCRLDRRYLDRQKVLRACRRWVVCVLLRNGWGRMVRRNVQSPKASFALFLCHNTFILNFFFQH